MEPEDSTQNQNPQKDRCENTTSQQFLPHIDIHSPTPEKTLPRTCLHPACTQICTHARTTEDAPNVAVMIEAEERFSPSNKAEAAKVELAPVHQQRVRYVALD